MPTIELISIGCEQMPNFSRYTTFLVVAEIGRPRSHRGSFQKTFDKQRGLIVHLGNKDLTPGEGFWYADKLIDWRKVDALVPLGSGGNKMCIFKKKVGIELKRLISRLLECSPVGRVLFCTDYQFTQNPPRENPPLRASEFSEMIDSGTIPFNALYWISR